MLWKCYVWRPGRADIANDEGGRDGQLAGRNPPVDGSTIEQTGVMRGGGWTCTAGTAGRITATHNRTAYSMLLFLLSQLRHTRVHHILLL